MNDDERVNDPLGNPEDGHILTRAIIDTIREPLIVLDEDLRVIVASRAFYKKFNQLPESAQGKMFYDLGNGEWNVPSLRALLERVIPGQTIIEDYEVEHVFSPPLGYRVMLINAREVLYHNGKKKMLLSISDVTHQRALDSERDKLIAQKDLLLKEMRHRIANSLQLIASILLLKAKTVDSLESKSHLEDAHERILSIATAQKQLNPVEYGEEIDVSAYLTALCNSISRSMISAHNRPATLRVTASEGTVTPDVAISFGLITTELVINSLKHAFPENRPGKIEVTYSQTPIGWRLSVADDGVGKSDSSHSVIGGLGTSIIGALANQLHAIIRTESTSAGTKVSIVYVSQ